MKIVINSCYGGFSISRKALHRLRELGSQPALDDIDIGEKWEDSGKLRTENYGTWYLYGISRNDPLLVQVVEELGKDADGAHAELKVVEIPDGMEWELEEYDGIEHIAEAHRTWF